MMRYRVTHSTNYAYEEPSPVCQNKVHLAPRESNLQKTRSFRLHIVPEPIAVVERRDYFGNHVHYFAVHDPHRLLSITASSEIELVAAKTSNNDLSSPPWEHVRDAINAPTNELDAMAALFAANSTYIGKNPELADYARVSFLPQRPMLDASADLTRRIHTDFKYVPQATSVSTPVADVFRDRVGVCQDFAQLQIACLRSIGLAARYVSGYLRTTPPPGKPRLVGVDASHAWIAVWNRGDQWIDFDPTNNVTPAGDHLTVAFGRDYADVCPIQGVFVGGGQNRLTVAVDVDAVDKGNYG